MGKQNLFGIPATEILENAIRAAACNKAIRALEAHIANKANILEHEELGDWAFWYACYVIRGRWLEAEEVIKQSPKWACRYARDVIKGRWIEGEDVIKKSPAWTYYYARFVIKGRWLEAEETIKQDSLHGQWYARDVVEGRML